MNRNYKNICFLNEQILFEKNGKELRLRTGENLYS